MNAYHRLTGAALSAILLLSFTGCGGGSGGGTLPSTGTKSTPTPAPTAKSSSSPAPSPSASNSPTPTPAPTATPTATPAPTPTPVPTPTPATVMYVSDYTASNVYVYSTGSTPTLIRTLTTNINNPERIAVDSSGTLYVVNNTDGEIVEYPAGATTPSKMFYSGFAHPFGIAVAPDGTVYVSSGQTASPHGVNAFAPGSTTVTRTVGTDIDTTFGVEGVALDSTGNLYVVGFLPSGSGAPIGKVYMIPGGTATSSTDLGLQGLNNPNSLVFDPSGNLVISNSNFGAPAVDFFTPGSTTMYSQITSGIFLPDGMNYDSTGTLWVVSPASSTFGPGYVSGFAPGATSPTTSVTSGLQGPTDVVFGPGS